MEAQGLESYTTFARRMSDASRPTIKSPRASRPSLDEGPNNSPLSPKPDGWFSENAKLETNKSYNGDASNITSTELVNVGVASPKDEKFLRDSMAWRDLSVGTDDDQ